MSDEQPTRPLPDGDAPVQDASSLKGLTMALGIGPAESGQDPLLGRDIGGVTVVRLIAEGGMGRVYEGKQEKPSRTVAVKVMRPGLTSPSVLKRFEYEAELLGRLQHPGIAHIYSVGVHRMGAATVPYFVMEYIAEARTLTQYSNDLKLPTRQRLDLFRSVCDAVAHGHQKGVIHRDLKPSNILVNASGRPKIIDFGVARATDSDMALTTMQTDVGQLIGTLQYMSPEQFNADPNDIDIRSDVYALGVILYELLAGKPPYDVKKKAIYEVMRIVREEDPTPLSSFNRALRGDVAVIAGKCLEKDRGRRYSSASELGADVARYLSGEPISASPPGFIHGLLRLARKHRTAAGAVAAVLVTLVAAVVGVAFFALQADRQRALAVRERDRANANEQAAVGAKEFATAQAANAEQRLYYANLYRLGRMAAGDRAGSAADFFAETARLSRAEALPIELRCLRAGLDGAQAVFRDFTASGVLAVSPDGARFASPVADHGVGVCEIDTGARIVLHGHADDVVAIAFSPDGTTLATASKDKTARIWGAKTGDVLQVLAGHDDALTAIAYAAEGDTIVTASRDKTARVWDAKSGAERHVWKGHEQALSCIAVSEDGTLVATGCTGGRAVAWDVASGAQRATMQWEECGVASLSFSPDGAFLAVGSDQGRALVWNVSTGQRVAAIGEVALQLAAPCTAAFTPDGRRLVTMSEGLVTAWSTDSLGTEDLTIGDDVTVVREFCWLPGTIVGARESEFQVFSERYAKDPEWVPKAAVNRRLRQEFCCATQSPIFSFSGDARSILTCSRDGTVGIWDARTGMRTGSLVGHDGVVTRALAPRNAARVVTKGAEGCVRTWDLQECIASGCCLLEHPSITDRFIMQPEDIATSPDGRFMATGGKVNAVSSELSLWGAATGEKIATWFGTGHSSPYAVTFSPDGRRLAACWRGRLRGALIDTTTGTCASLLKGHALEVCCLAFSPDGRFLATAAADGTVRLWDARSGKPMNPSAEWARYSGAQLEHRPDIVIDDFERDAWAPWKTEGTAFGKGPFRRLPQDRRPGFSGRRFASSGSRGVGKATSPPIRIDRLFITMKVPAGRSPSYERYAALVVSGSTVRRALGPDDSGVMDVVWDVREFVGREATIEIVDTDPSDESFHVDRIAMTDAPGKTSTPGLLHAHAGTISGIAFSPAGDSFVTVSGRPDAYETYSRGELRRHSHPADGTARIWDARNGCLRATVPFTGCGLASAAFSPDGGRIVVVEGKGVVVRSVPSGDEVLRLEGHADDVTMATFSADGRLIATASDDNTARLWEADTGRVRAILRGHVGGVTMARFNPDGSRLLTRGGDDKAAVWDTRTGVQVLSLGNELVSIRKAIFTSGGDRILTCSNDRKTGGAGIWGVSNADIRAARLRSRAARERLGPMVDQWLQAGIDAARQELENAEGQLSADDYREASILLVERGNDLEHERLRQQDR